jgi:hypothetical protein
MALRNRQDGKVEIFVGTQKIDGLSKNVIEFDELALKTDIATATAAAIIAQTNGFTITKGTTPKTLTVALDANVAGTNTGDETASTIKTKLSITTLSGSNTGDDDKASLIIKLGIQTALDDAAAALLNPVVAVGGLYYTGTVFKVRLA